MYCKDRIISEFARRACKAVSARVIRELQKITQGMQSGDDSCLENIWDEVCVQVQGEESVMWELYTDMIEDIIRTGVEKLDEETAASIWLQTDEGDDWVDWVEDEYEGGIGQPDKVACNTDDIARYILNEYVLSAAADWTNRRIDRFLSEGYGW